MRKLIFAASMLVLAWPALAQPALAQPAPAQAPSAAAQFTGQLAATLTTTLEQNASLAAQLRTTQQELAQVKSAAAAAIAKEHDVNDSSKAQRESR